MKILKRASQKNVRLDTEFYTRDEIEHLKFIGVVYDLKEMYEGTFDKEELVIFTDDLKEIKVILDEEGVYRTVAINQNNEKFFIKL